MKRHRYRLTAAVFVHLLPFITIQSSPGQTSQSADDQSPAATQPAEKKDEKPAKKSYYVAPRSTGTKLEPDPPSYVKTADKLSPGLEDLKWLQLGLEQRTRFEYREDDYRKSKLTHDEPFLMRNRGFLGITDIIDPFRFAVEFQDARIFNSKFPDTTGDVDEADILQLYGELYFKDLAGENQPVRFRYGRMTLDVGDRWLVARTRFGNTVQPYDGFRLTIGDQNSLWQVDTFALQPVVRRVRQFNHADEEKWFYGIIGDWRGWSEWVTLEPYWFILDEDHDGYTLADREIHTMGLRAYGVLGKSGWDYDVNAGFQFGYDGGREQRSFATRGEIGYTFDHPWNPRLSFATAYADGDGSSTDGVAERWDKLYGSTDVLSNTGMFSWTNIIAPKLRFEFQPVKPVRLDAGYGAYWLARDSDAWVQVGRKLPATAQAGTCLGQEIECRMRWQIDPRLELTVGYIHFIQGEFVNRSGPADDCDFFYAQTVMNLFK